MMRYDTTAPDKSGPETKTVEWEGQNAWPNQETSKVDIDMPDIAEATRLSKGLLKGRTLGFMVTFVAGTGFTLFGYDQGVLSGALTLKSFTDTFPQTNTEWHGGGGNHATLQSFLVAIYELGCMAGALSNLWVGDRLGRRHTITLGGIIMVIGAILQTAAVNYAMMLVARVVTGVGNGLLTSTVPAYQAECAKPERRGQLVLFEGSLITFGIMIAYWVNVGCYFIKSSASWRVPLGIQIVFAVLMICTMYGFKLPESPRWLVARGKHTAAIAVLAALDNTTPEDPAVQQTFRGIVDAVFAEEKQGFHISKVFHQGRSQNFRRTLLGVLAQCFQQISGINLITYVSGTVFLASADIQYLTSVLVSMGLGAEMSRVISGVNGTCYFLTSLAALFMVERFGRRPLMLSTALLQAATMAILAGLYNINAEGNKVAQVFSVLMLFLFNTWFSVGWLGMTWLYPAEITPLPIRAPANALSTASNWLFNFMVVMSTGPMFDNIRWGTYALFACTNALIIFPVVLFFFPETKRRSLEQMDVCFALAHNERMSPVKVSLRDDIPAAGSPEAERILGRAPDEVEKHRHDAGADNV